MFYDYSVVQASACKIMNKFIIIKILIAIGILLLGLLASMIVFETAYSRLTAGLSESEKQVEKQIVAQIAQQTDAYKLTKNGLRQLNINLPNLALISLKRATEIEKNYRDAWLALGLAQLKTGDIKTALASFQTAEKLDPINAKTYEFLKIVYEKVGQLESAKVAQEKYEFLTKR